LFNKATANLAATALGLLLYTAGCGGSSGTPFGGADAGDAPSGPTVAQSCADLAQAQCAKRMICSNGVSITRLYGSMDTCISRVTAQCTAGLAAPQSGNSASLAEQCVAAYPQLACADFLDGVLTDVCAPLGPRAAGQPCAFNGQCASGFCSGTKNATCGTCAPSPAVGDSCATSSCGHGQTCVLTTTMCEDYGASAATCSTASPCGSGLACTGILSTAVSSGTCQVAATEVGAACGGTMPGCSGTLGLYCAGAVGAKACAAIAFASEGMPCGELSTTSHVECTAGGCYTATGLAGTTEVGTCKADAADGAACDTVLGPACLTPARCVPTGAGSAGLCTFPSGATCG